MPAHTPDDERRAADPSTEPEVLEYLAKAFPDLRPVVAANPATPAVLREQVLQMGLGNLSQVSPATPVSAATASDSTHLRTAKTAALPSITTTDYRSSPHTEAPVRATVQADPHTAVLKTLPTMPTRAGAPAPAQTAPVEPSEPRPASRSGSRTGLIAALVITLVLAVAAAGTFAGMLLANRDRQSETTTASAASAAPAPTQAAETSAGQNAQPTADATEAEATPLPDKGPTLPPSAKTYSYQYVDTPSKNISCILYDEGVGCSILERSYASSGMQDCPDREFSIVALAGRTEVRCGEEYLGQPGDTFHTLEYGETTTFSDYACTSQSKGMTCWNTITGRGFTISRDSHVRF